MLTFLQPEQAASIVAKVIPANIEFYRTPMPPQTPPKKISPSLASSSALSAAAENAKRDSMKMAIYGSVSTADILATMKAILCEDTEGSLVILTPENISFAHETAPEDNDRVKHLGSFTIEIRLGPSEAERVRRSITVRAQQ